jgi:hypothetical protein
MRAGLRILLRAIPAVAVAVGVVDLIVLGPMCISDDCTSAQRNWKPERIRWQAWISTTPGSERRNR